MLLPALVSPPGAYLPAVMAALALGVAISVWPVGRVSLARAAAGLAVLSLAADTVAFGKAGLALLWLPFEAVALLVLLERVVRHVPGPRVGLVGGLTGAAVVLLPLRFTLHAPQTGLKESVFLAALAFVPAAGAGASGSICGRWTGGGPMPWRWPGASSGLKSPAICMTSWPMR